MLCGGDSALEIVFEFAMIYPCCVVEIAFEFIRCCAGVVFICLVTINFVTVRECVCLCVWTGDDAPFPHGVDGGLREHGLLCLRVVESVGILLFLVDCVSKCAVGGRR